MNEYNAMAAVQLLLHSLAVHTRIHTATLLIDTANAASIALAERAHFERLTDRDNNARYARAVRPLECPDGIATTRKRAGSDGGPGQGLA